MKSWQTEKARCRLGQGSAEVKSHHAKKGGRQGDPRIEVKKPDHYEPNQGKKEPGG